MSPSVGNFVTDLVEMAKATEQLPIVERERDQLKADNDTLRDTIQSLQLRAIDRKEEIERHLATIRQLEVARDDAELRFLEADEHASHVLSMVRASMVGLEKAALILDPPKPQPEAIPEVVKGIEEVPALDPTGSSSGGQFPPEAPDYSKADAEPVPVEQSPYYNAPAGQSEADPIASTGQASMENVPTSSNVLESVSTHEPYPYSDKRDYDIPTWISYHDWIAGGGTEDDYNQRPISKTAW
jgi:hypothetical protein